MRNIYDFIINVWKENKAYYRGESSFVEEKLDRVQEVSDSNSVKIPVLFGSRVEKSFLSKKQKHQFSVLIEDEMKNFQCLPYQICNCSYIGEHVAWTTYNLTNKRCLQLAIEELNLHLKTIKDLDDVVKRVIPTDYHIRFDEIFYEFTNCTSEDDLPRSYILYRPKTKNGKIAKYPLIAYFDTAKTVKNPNEENYCGELYYSVNGELCDARLHCWKHGIYSQIILGMVGRSFIIKKIKSHDKNGKLFTFYDCKWAFTDYIDFA